MRLFVPYEIDHGVRQGDISAVYSLLVDESAAGGIAMCGSVKTPRSTTGPPSLSCVAVITVLSVPRSVTVGDCISSARVLLLGEANFSLSRESEAGTAAWAELGLALSTGSFDPFRLLALFSAGDVERKGFFPDELNILRVRFEHRRRRRWCVERGD